MTLEIMLGLVFIGQVLDFLTTRYILQSGGRELVPTSRWIQDHLGLVPWTAIKLTLTMLFTYWTWPMQFVGWIMVAGGVLPALWNFGQIAKSRRR